MGKSFQFQTFPLSNSRLINLSRFTELQYWLDVIILKTKNFLSFSDEHFSPRFNFMQFDHFLRTFFSNFLRVSSYSDHSEPIKILNLCLLSNQLIFWLKNWLYKGFSPWYNIHPRLIRNLLRCSQLKIFVKQEKW